MSIKIGDYVIVRCTGAGVHAGVLVSLDGQTVELRDARRLWYWRVPMGCGSFLSGVAVHGLGDGCKLGEPISVILTEVCEVIACCDVARASIAAYNSLPRMS